MTPKMLIQLEYGNSKNFMTPNVIGYRWIVKEKLACELSSGSGLINHSTIYGFSVVELLEVKEEDGKKVTVTKRRHDLSDGGFYSLEDAKKAIWLAKEKYLS